jgi:CubicO group peptidase (beta-lactamase class C family)
MRPSDSSSPLPRSTPESQGVSSEALLRLITALETNALELHSIMILRHGRVVAEGWWDPYRAETPHPLFSLSKSFTATAVGFAVVEGRFSLDDPVLSFFPEEAPAEPGKYLRAMRVRHLLSMSTGHSRDTLGKVFGNFNQTKGFLQCPVVYAPGTHFVYNNGASFMLSAILQRVTGRRLLDYLSTQLLYPLDITGATWDTSAGGFDVGYRGLKIKTEDIARFGQLYLQKGRWGDVRLLPERWVEEATALQVANGNGRHIDYRQGYGLQFWRCRHNAYRGEGAFGQLCIVLPEQETVVAITAGTGKAQAVLNLLWHHLLPALGPLPLPADPDAETALRRKLASLKLPGPDGDPASPAAAGISGHTFHLETNPRGYRAIGFDFFAADFCRIRLHNAHGEHRLVCRMNHEWQRTTTRFDGKEASTVAMTGAWTTPDTFTFRLCLIETPDCPTIICRFQADRVRIRYRPNIKHCSTPFPEIVGRRE